MAKHNLLLNGLKKIHLERSDAGGDESIKSYLSFQTFTGKSSNQGEVFFNYSPRIHWTLVLLLKLKMSPLWEAFILFFKQLVIKLVNN